MIRECGGAEDAVDDRDARFADAHREERRALRRMVEAKRAGLTAEITEKLR